MPLTAALTAAQPYFTTVVGILGTAYFATRKTKQERSDRAEDTSYNRLKGDYDRCKSDCAALATERDALKSGAEQAEAELRAISAEMERRDGKLRWRGFETADAAFAWIDAKRAEERERETKGT